MQRRPIVFSPGINRGPVVHQHPDRPGFAVQGGHMNRGHLLGLFLGGDLGSFLNQAPDKPGLPGFGRLEKLAVNFPHWPRVLRRELCPGRHNSQAYKQ